MEKKGRYKMSFSEELEEAILEYPPTRWVVQHRYILLIFVPVLLMFIISMIVIIAEPGTNGIP